VERVNCQLIQHRPLPGAQHIELAAVKRRPITVEDAAGIPCVRIPCPIGIVDLILFQECYQRALPDPLGILTHRGPSELTQQYRGDSILLQIGPVLLPDARKPLREVRGLETRNQGSL